MSIAKAAFASAHKKNFLAVAENFRRNGICFRVDYDSSRRDAHDGVFAACSRFISS